MDRVHVGPVRPWVGMAVAAVLLALAAETACGQQYVPAGPRPEDFAAAKAMRESSDSWSFVIINTVGVYPFALGILAGVSLVASALVRFYFRAATPDDPRKLAMTDPWVRARLAQLKGGAPGNLPAEPGAGTPPGS